MDRWRGGWCRSLNATHDADANLFLKLIVERREQLDLPHAAIFHFQRPYVAAAGLEVELERFLVAIILSDALHVRVAPAGVDPDLHVIQTLHLAIVAFDHELHIVMVTAVGVGPEVQRRFLDLNALAAGVA